MEADLIYIGIVEDNRHVRTAWEMSLNSQPDMRVVASYGNCEEAIVSETFAEADVVIMDIGLPGMSGIEGVKWLKKHHPDILAVMCTVHEDNDRIFEALCAGAVGYLLKKTPPAQLVQAIRDAYRGGSPMTPTVAREVIAAFQIPADKTAHAVRLSEREEEILSRMAQGKSYATIAGEICLSVDGVGYHVRHIYEKLQVHSRAEAVAAAIKKRLIPPPR